MNNSINENIKCFGCEAIMGRKGEYAAEEFQPIHHLNRICSSGELLGCESFWEEHKIICNGCFNGNNLQKWEADGWHL